LDLFALNLDFDAERRTNVGALDDGAANPNIAGKIDGVQGVVEGMTARIANERMSGTAITVVGAEFIEVGDEFELAIAVGSLAGVRPITSDRTGRTTRQTNDRCRDILTGELIADKKIDRGPGFGEIADLRDGRMGLVGVRQQGIRVRLRRRNLDLGSGLRTAGLLRGPRVRKPADR